jgi:hypothetical protein
MEENARDARGKAGRGREVAETDNLLTSSNSARGSAFNRGSAWVELLNGASGQVRGRGRFVGRSRGAWSWLHGG